MANRTKGMLIAVEGLDGSGKQTQTQMLVNRLSKEYVQTLYRPFPSYDKPTGKILRRYLDGEFGDISPGSAALLYAANRLEERDTIYRYLELGAAVVCDRYVESNKAYQCARMFMDGVDTDTIAQFKRDLDYLEYIINDMPEADLTIYIDTPAEECAKRMKGRAGLDTYESNLALQKAVSSFYKIAHVSDLTAIVEGEYPLSIWIPTFEGGNPLSKEQIHHNIVDGILPILKSIQAA